MRRFAAVPAALALALAGCGGDGEEESPDPPVDTAAQEESSSPEPCAPDELDLSEAGGACPLIDSALLDRITGEDFRFASGGPSEDSDEEDAPDQATCAVQTGEAAYPDLTLYVIGTEAGVEVYEDELPDGAESVEDLGEAAYWIVHTEDTGAGPALELGWYEDGEIFEMRYTTPEGTEGDAVRELVEGFTELAGGIDAAQDEAAADD